MKGTTSTSYGSVARFIGNERIRFGWWETAVMMDDPFHFSFQKRLSYTSDITWLYLIVRIGRLQLDWKVWRCAP